MARLVLAFVLVSALPACSPRPAMPCDVDDDCPVGCCRPNRAGDLFCTTMCPCATDADCTTGSVCERNWEAERVCMPTCPASRETTCFDGTFCHEVEDGRRVCWPGGPTARGADCEYLVECERGSICVGVRDVPGTAVCQDACEYAAPGMGTSEVCPVGTMCTRTVEGNGFCPER